MPFTNENATIQYVARIERVKEVILQGTADLTYWREHVQGEGLFPYNREDSAALLITATNLRWMGFRFRELTVSVGVCWRENGATHDGLYLAHAFNSSPILAWMERRFFQTPYDSGKIGVDHHFPAFLALADNRGIRLHAAMSGNSSPSHTENLLWEGPIFLPGHPGSRKFFFARLSGLATTYPFVPGQDSLTLKPSTDNQVFRWLHESRFTPTLWQIRANGNHAKSKTYPSSRLHPESGAFR